jgi:hypothetical protein
VYAVCAYHNVSLDGVAIMEMHLDAVFVLGQSDASMVKMKHPGWNGRRKNVKQIGAMEVIVGGAEVTLACVGQRLASKFTPVVPAPEHDRVRPHSFAAKCVAESEPMKDSRRVGADLYAGADFTQIGGLFKYLNIGARSR